MTQVTEHLETHGVPFGPFAHRQTYTSIAEARALGIDASEVLKTVAMRVAGGYAQMAKGTGPAGRLGTCVPSSDARSRRASRA